MSRQHRPLPGSSFLVRWGLWEAPGRALTAPQRALVYHGGAYIVVSVLLCVFWLSVGDTYFNPQLPVLGWGAGLAWHAWRVVTDRSSNPD